MLQFLAHAYYQKTTLLEMIVAATVTSQLLRACLRQTRLLRIFRANLALEIGSSSTYTLLWRNVFCISQPYTGNICIISPPCYSSQIFRIECFPYTAILLPATLNITAIATLRMIRRTESSILRDVKASGSADSFPTTIR